MFGVAAIATFGFDVLRVREPRLLDGGYWGLIAMLAIAAAWLGMAGALIRTHVLSWFGWMMAVLFLAACTLFAIA